MSDTKRLFIAIELPAKLKKTLFSIKCDLKGVTWAPAEQIHITLAFLGDQDEEIIPDLKYELNKIQWRDFSLTFDNVGFFPNQQHPNVFWIGYDDSDELIHLKREIDQKLQTVGIKQEERPFAPHTTLARIKRNFERKNADFLVTQSARLPRASFKVTGFTLFSSELNQNRAFHYPLVTFPY